MIQTNSSSDVQGQFILMCTYKASQVTPHVTMQQHTNMTMHRHSTVIDDIASWRQLLYTHHSSLTWSSKAFSLMRISFLRMNGGSKGEL